MRNILLGFVIFSLTFSVLTAQSTRKSRSIKPTVFQKRVTTLIGDKSRYYYSLSTYKPSTVIFQGPGKLRIITRGRFVPKDGDEIEYQINYSVNDEEQKSIYFSDVEPSGAATYLKESLGVPGQLEDFEIEVGRGYHTIEFYINDTNIPVAARYFFTPIRYEKQKWISFSPLKPSEPVDLITKESTVNYYRFSMDMPLMVTINGPTELRVLTRIENNYQMKGRIHYRMQVKEKGNVINSYQLSSLRSEVTMYKNNTELIPGKACEFVVNVPKGRHTYEILPLDKDKNTLLGRFLIPKKDVKLECF